MSFKLTRLVSNCEDAMIATHRGKRVAMVGSGAWACAAVRMVAQSTAEAAQSPASCFEPEVTMWVHEEKHSGRNLTEAHVSVLCVCSSVSIALILGLPVPFER
eukprot:1159870-Pelagomonas_calceolata.AAC.8